MSTCLISRSDMDPETCTLDEDDAMRISAMMGDGELDCIKISDLPDKLFLKTLPSRV